MNFLKKLFGSKTTGNGSGNLSKVSVMLDEDQYWKIIAESLGNPILAQVFPTLSPKFQTQSLWDHLMPF